MIPILSMSNLYLPGFFWIFSLPLYSLEGCLDVPAGQTALSWTEGGLVKN